MTSKARRGLLGLIAMFLSLLGTLLIAEVAFRLCYSAKSVEPPYLRNRVSRFEPHPFLPYTGRANDRRTLPWRHEFFGEFTLNYHNNSYGFLGDEFRFDKPPGEIRIVTVGGSTTWGMGIDRTTRTGDETNTWPSILQRKLAAKFPDRTVTVYNLAQDAFASPMSVVNLAFVGVNLHPDFVISCDGINDMRHTFDGEMRIDYSGRFTHYTGYRSIGLNWPAWVFRSRFVCWVVSKVDVILGFGRATDALAAVSPPPPRHSASGSSWNSATLKNVDLFERNLKTMKGISREYGAVFVAGTLHYFKRDKLRGEFNERLREFYRREQIPFFDADKLIPKGSITINTDEVHFTKDGAELMADGFAEVLSPIISAQVRK